MEKVLGIGGLFFRAKDPAALAKWYADTLGINEVPQDYDSPAWRSNGGTTVFAPFAQDTGYFGNPNQQWMINFRVADLAKMTAQLKVAGTIVEFEGEEPNGKFARCADPEGNPIQLWEPLGQSVETEEK